MKNNREEDIENFEGMLPKDQEWFSPKEVGYIIGRSDQFVRDSISDGIIFAHNTAWIKDSKIDKRNYMRVHKKMLTLYLMETANYSAEMFTESLKQLIGQCTNYQLLILEKHIKEILFLGRRYSK